MAKISEARTHMTYASVCAGIEAATVAWEPLGWKPLWFSEIEKFPCEVLAHHYPSVPNLGDMTKLYAHPIAQKTRIDLLVGGTPCPSFSQAGDRRGVDDIRGRLAFEYLKVVEFTQPRWFVFENVPGMLTVNGGRAFRQFITQVQKLRYGFAYRVLDAQYFGVPQRRRRVFVVGHAGGDWRRATAALFEPESMLGDTASCESAGQNAIPSKISEGACQTGIVEGVDIYNYNFIGDIAVTLGANSCGVNTHGPKILDVHGVRVLTPNECERLQGFPDDYTLLPGRCLDTWRTKALGNSMAVPVMRWIGERIQMVDTIVRS